MSKCYAFTNKNKACRGYATILHKTDEVVLYRTTCKQHEGFFNDEAALKRKIFGGVGRRCKTRMLEWSPLKECIEDILRLELITVTQEDIAALVNPFPRASAYFILLCARHVDDFQISWNMPVCNDSLRTLWRWHNSIGPVVISLRDITQFFRNNPMSLYTSIYLARPEQVTHLEWFPLMQEYAKTSWFSKFILLTNETHTEEIEKIESTGIVLEGFVNWIKEEKNVFYLKQKTSIDTLKEELVAKCWHPTRFVRWCLDETDKQFITENTTP